MSPHLDQSVSLQFSYPDERRARLIEQAISVEVGQIEDARSGATVTRQGSVVDVTIEAADLVALRAGCNSWTRLVEVAETVSARADRPDSP